jgi:hypothetical protein
MKRNCGRQIWLLPCAVIFLFQIKLDWLQQFEGNSGEEVLPPNSGDEQRCQMVYFQTKNPNLGKFWRFLKCKILAKLLTIWSILRQLEIFYGHLVYFVVIWYIFTRISILYSFS